MKTYLVAGVINARQWVLICDAAGVLMVFFGSPINFHTIDGGDSSTDFNKIKRQVERKNRLVKWGVIVILFGFLLQIISNFV